MLGPSFWAWFGSTALLILVYTDLKRMSVDERRNYFMMGVSLSLISHIYRPLWYILLVIALVVGISFLINKFKLLGEGDTTGIAWVFYGFAIFGTDVLFAFFVIWSVLTSLQWVFKNYVFKIIGPVPYYPVILLSFVCTCLLFGLY